MSAIDHSDLLPSLRKTSWDVAYRTYGGSHATWVGLLVEWWIGLKPASHTVLDGAPSFGRGRVGQGDALFCQDDHPVGVLEVEGSEPEKTIRTIEQYFKSTRPELKPIWFGLLMLYSYEPRGSGSGRRFPPAEDPAAMSVARQLSAKFSNHSVVILALDKEFGRHTGIRGTREYYAGTLSRVTGVRLQGGDERVRRVLFAAPNSC